MNTRNLLTVLILISTMSAAAFAQSQDPPHPSELKRRIVKRHYDDVSDKDRWEVKAAYPEVRLKGDRPLKQFNAAVKSLVMKSVGRFKNSMAEMAKDGTISANMNYYHSINYEATHFDEDVVSIRFFISEYTGGAHPNHWFDAITYSLSDDKKLEFADFFKPNAKYLDLISKESIKQIASKMGDFNANDWIKEGAAPNAKNFKNWNIGKNGFEFSFDPYQVGPYAAGSFETVVPYEKFPYSMHSDRFHIAESASYIDGSPPSNCRSGRWTKLDSEYKLASVLGKKNTRSYFYNDDRDCPDGVNCKRKSYVIAGDEVIVQREYLGYSCVWFQPKKGSETVGWLKSDTIKTRQEAVKPPRNWVGDWSHHGNEISIKESPGGKLHVYGTAIWKGLGDNVHVGEIDYLEMPGPSVLKVGDGDNEYDCRVRLRRLGRYLLVDDNLNCGGVNVSFNGVYVRK